MNTPSRKPTIHSEPAALRAAIRSGQFDAHTSGQCPGYAQANLAVLPRDYATEFLRFCQLNPKPCPILGVSEPGDPRIPALGADVDISTDICGYYVFKDGEMSGEVPNLKAVWRDDSVAFAIGCSFSFEEALVEGGIPLRHIEQGCNVAMYRTNIATRGAGRFGGPTVVSMRPMKPADAIRAIQITSRFPDVHGAPIHFGDPAMIGIADIGKPDFGDAVEIRKGEVPVFWACGVTPQSAIRAAKPPLAFTHKPGCMLVTDLRNSQLAVF
ncbi:unnamed protein product [Phaeothamnion confervicola]